MATETIEEFLARGGSVEKSTEKVSLAELLKSEGMLNAVDAENISKDLNEALQSSIDKDLKK
jgi:hypothetical protein